VTRYLPTTGLEAHYHAHELVHVTKHGGLLYRTGDGAQLAGAWARARDAEHMEAHLADRKADLEAQHGQGFGRSGSIRAGLEASRARGKQGSGEAPFGYRMRKGRLQPHEPEQATLRRLAALRAAGESMRACALILTQEGYQPRGQRWHTTTIARLCKLLQANALEDLSDAPF
jgi:hypothetical protein